MSIFSLLRIFLLLGIVSFLAACDQDQATNSSTAIPADAYQGQELQLVNLSEQLKEGVATLVLNFSIPLQQ